MICSFAWSSAAFSPTLPLKGWNQGYIHVWTHQKRNGQEYRRETTSTHQDAFRLMNAYLDALGSAAADSAPGRPLGVRRFHPQRQQYQSKAIVGQKVIQQRQQLCRRQNPNGVCSTGNNQNQYFQQPQYSMQQPQPDGLTSWKPPTMRPRQFTSSGTMMGLNLEVISEDAESVFEDFPSATSTNNSVASDKEK